MLMMNLVQLAIKYAIVGVAVALAAVAIPRRSLNISEVAALGATAGASFLILDMFAPNVGMGARQGAGFGIGNALVRGGGAAAAAIGGVAAPLPILEGMGEDGEQEY